MEKKTNVQDELNVQRINICERNGQVRMSLFNSDTIPPAIIGGQDILPGHRQGEGFAGIMFYNNQGDECGGLLFNGREDDEGNPAMGISLTFDQYQQDQVLQISLAEEDGKQSYGVSFYDRPRVPITQTIAHLSELESGPTPERRAELERLLATSNASRGFLGKSSDGSMCLRLNDSQGRRRIEIAIDRDDNTVFRVWDADGQQREIRPE